MGRYNRRSNTGWWLVPTIADLDAPTVAEINAGVALHEVLAAMNGFTGDQEDLPVPDVGSTWPKTIPGGETVDASSLTFWAGDDDADTEEVVRAAMVAGDGTEKYVVQIKRQKTPAAGEPADVFPVRIKKTNEVHTADNAGAQFMTGFSIHDTPHRHVDIAA